MKVTVRMSGLLAGYLSGSDRRDGVAVQLLDGTTVGGLMARIGLPDDEKYLVIVNDSAVPKERRASEVLRDGDRVAIVPPLKGG